MSNTHGDVISKKGKDFITEDYLGDSTLSLFEIFKQ